MNDLIYRRVDDLGRIVIPKNIRKQIGLQECEAMTIEVNENNQIILTKIIFEEDV